MRGVTILLALTTLLAACGSSNDTDRQEQAAGSAARRPAPHDPRPGLYRSTSTLTGFTIPGMSAAQSEKLREMFATTRQEREFCLTATEAAQGMKGAVHHLAEGACALGSFSTRGAAFDARLTCTTGKGMVAKVDMTGTMAAETSQVTLRIDQRGPANAPGEPVRMEAQVASQRVGDCP